MRAHRQKTVARINFWREIFSKAWAEGIKSGLRQTADH